MMITQSINLNLIPGGVLPRINVSQYDKGSRTLQFVLFNGPVLYSIESGTEITIQGSKPDNTAFQYDCTWQGSTVSMDIEQQMTAVAGDVICELVISNNGEILGTCNFILNVESAAVSDDTVISETELPLIERAVEAAVEAAASAASAAQSAEDAAQSAARIQTLTNQVKDMNNVYGAKNLLSQKYMQVLLGGIPVGRKVESINGLTIVYGEDGSIEVNGTPTDSSKNVEIHFDWTTSVHDYNIENLAGKKVIGSITDTAINGIRLFLGCFLSNGTANQSGYIYTNGEYTYPSDAVQGRTWLSISGGYSYNHAKVYPMIRLASITDDTYEPYAMTNRELTENTGVIEPMLNVLGAKNVLFNRIESQVINGITIVRNSDDSLTLNGTATQTSYIGLDYVGTTCLSDISKFRNKEFIASISDEAIGGVSLHVGYFDTSNVAHDVWNVTTNLKFTWPNDVATGRCYIFIASGTTISNKTVYPMIRPSGIEDNTYVPYAKTNRELTEDIDTVSSEISTLNASSYIDVSGNYASIRLRRVGNIKMIYINGFKNLTVGTLYTMSGFIPDDYLPIQDMAISVFSPISDGAHEMYRVTLKNNGDLSIYAYNSIVAQANARTVFTYL